MGHYEEQIAKAAEEIRNHRKKIEDSGGIEEALLEGMTPFKAHADIIAPLKDVEGKAHGARYCFLNDIANCVLGGVNVNPTYRDELSYIGETLSTIVRAYDKGWIKDAQHYCSVLIQDLLERDKNLHHELVKVRMHALDSGKYTSEGYREEIDVALLLDAAARHYIKILFDGDIDEESGCTHLAHMAANAIMIHTQLSLYKG